MIRSALAILLMRCAQCFPTVLHAQVVTLSVLPTFGNKPLMLDNEQYAVGSDSVHISTFRFYISGITLYQDASVVWTEPASYHLIDVSDPSSLQLALAPSKDIRYNKIVFNLGIDSATNTQGAGGGDLDATRGMYWAWQSGYINMKVEGTSPVCTTRKHQFQYHLGGFRGADYCMQQIMLSVPGNEQITLGVDLRAFLTNVDLKDKAELMVPGPAAVALSQKAATMFHIISKGE